MTAGAGTERSQANPAFFRRMGAACEAAHLSPEARAWYGLALALDPLDRPTQQALHRLRTVGRGT
jgi:hypothetical protein